MDIITSAPQRSEEAEIMGKCACGNTQNTEGNCDGSHAKKDK
jgi:CDGSH-type Zn-finger protein